MTDAGQQEPFHGRPSLDTSECYGDHVCTRKEATGEIMFCAKHYEMIYLESQIVDLQGQLAWMEEHGYALSSHYDAVALDLQHACSRWDLLNGAQKET